MAEERFLVTGALGCIGAWTVKRLLEAGVPVWTYDLPGSDHRLRLLLDDDARSAVHMLHGDITDEQTFERAVVENGITNIVHLAALQVPFVRANPIQGARVNVVGTTIVLEIAKRHADQLRGLSYASSAAVYGPYTIYPPGPLAHDAAQYPGTLYGVLKQANEGTARIYWQDYGVRSIGLRPNVVYGPGRDQGVSSTPTKAMVAAAVGRDYAIKGVKAAVFQYADDVAEIFIRAARAIADGAPVYNIGGSEAGIEEVIHAIETVVPEAAGHIHPDPEALPGVIAVDGHPLEEAIGAIAWTSLADGVQQSIERFRAAAAAGTLDVERVLA